MHYVGDEIMAFWNAPETVDDHPLKACRAALACVDAGRAIGPADAPRFETRFGLHTTTVSVGHFGSPDRLHYSAIGDGVNLTSRLEGLNKHYGTTILVSVTTWARVRDHVAGRRIDRVSVKCRSQGLLIYELMGWPNTPTTPTDGSPSTTRTRSPTTSSGGGPRRSPSS